MLNILITAGGTSEKIDNVRKITNSSTGKLGLMIAEEFLKEEQKINMIYYICSKNAYKPNHPKVKIIEITDTLELKNKIEQLLKEKNIDYVIHSMAVSDYMLNYVTNAHLLAQEMETRKLSPEQTIRENKAILSANKLSSKEENLILYLTPTPKIISLIKEISPTTYLVGFKLLDGVKEIELIETAKKLRDKNHCDLVVANDLENIRQGVHKAFLIDKKDNLIRAMEKKTLPKN